MDPKSDRKFDENVVKILIDFLMILGGLWAPFWDPLDPKIDAPVEARA